MKKVLLVGNFGSGNVGDELILCAALDAYKDQEVVVMTADEAWTKTFVGDETLECVPFFPTGGRSGAAWLFSRKYRKTLLNLQGEIETVVFAGGGLFAIKSKACWIWSTVYWWCRKTFPKAKIRLEHQGVDQKLSPPAKRLAQKVFVDADFISVRDEASKKALKDFGVTRVKVVGDRVEEWLKGASRKEKRGKRDKKVLLVNSVSVFEHLFYSRIQKLYENYSFKFILMDPLDQQWVPTGFRGDVVVLRTKEEAFDHFATADVAMGDRLHFLILAHQFLGNKKTYCLQKPYSEKVASFCKKTEISVFDEV